MIFGGSPIRVAVPQRFEAIIIGITKRTGLIQNILDMETATGTIKNIVVTLSRNADRTAVITKNEKNKRWIFHFDTSKSFTANHSNILVWDRTQTIIIIETSRAITSPSILLKACSRLRNCNSGIKCQKV